MQWRKLSTPDKLYAGIGYTFIGSVLVATICDIIWPSAKSEEPSTDDDDYIVLSKMDNFPLWLEQKKMIPLENAAVAEQADQLEERQVIGKVAICDRQPPMWIAVAAKKVIIVPLTFTAGLRRKEASLLEIEQAAGTPEVFRTNKLT